MVDEVQHPLQIPAFRRWIFLRAATTIGVQVQITALAWSVYAATGDPLDLAWLGLAQFLPMPLLVLPAGQAADRYDRRVILALAYFGHALLAAVLAILAASGQLGTGQVVVVALVQGSLRALGNPAGQALVPNLVPSGLLARALATSSVQWQLATILGPSIGGLVVASHSAAAAFALAALLMFVGGAALAGIPAARLPPRAVGWREVGAGVAYIWAHPLLLSCITLDLFAVLLGGATALLPIFAQDVLQVGAQGFGLLRASPGIGAGAMAAFLAWRPLSRRAGPSLLAAVGVFGLATVGFALSTSLTVSVGCLVVLGAADMVSVVLRQTLVQLRTPDELRGRVSAVNLVFIGASNELGEFESGLTARWWGAVRAALYGGLGTLAVAAAWAWWFPDLRRADKLA